MKHTLCYSAVLVGSLLLHGCGGGSLIGGPQDKSDLTPVTEEVKTYKLRPSATAPTITTKDGEIFDAAGKPVQLRGINLTFTKPATISRIAGIKAIKDTGSNTVHLYINENTTDPDLEVALTKVVEEGMLAIITLTDGSTTKVVGQTDVNALISAVNTLWLDKWLGVIAQDRFQPHIMINIADSWSKGIFDPDNGYYSFMNGYKVVIDLFRQAGLKVPLVISAPAGDDYNAFLSQRAEQLLAQDSAKNLVIGVKAGGKNWDSLTKLTNSFTGIKEAGLPYVVDAFGGAGIEENDVDHLTLMQKAIGDSALSLDVPWTAANDSAAYVIPFKEPMKLIDGVNFITNLYLTTPYLELGTTPTSDGHLVAQGKLTFAMHVRDVNGNTLRIGSVAASTLNDYQWNRVSFTMPKTLADVKPADYLNGATTIDFTQIKEVGVQLLANGKEAKVKGAIKLDDLEIYPGSPPPVITDFPFTVSTNGWFAKNATTALVDGAWSLLPTGVKTPKADKPGEFEDNKLEIALGDERKALDFSRPVMLKMRIFVPSEYAADLAGAYIAAYGMPEGAWNWQGFQIPSSAIKAGEWSDVNVTLNVKESPSHPGTIKNTQFGIQLGMNADTPRTLPILIDNITITQQEEQRMKTISITQHKFTFASTLPNPLEGFYNIGWDDGKATLKAEDGVLSVTVPEGDKGVVGLQHYTSGDAELAHMNTSGNTVIKMKVFTPADWAGKDFSLKLFMQNWASAQDKVHYQYAELKVADLAPGEWKNLEFKLNFPDGYKRGGVDVFGVQFGTVPAGILKFDDIEVIGETRVPDSLPIYTMGFDTQAEVDTVKFDFAGGSLSESALVSAKTKDWKIAPFGWTASSWFDLSNDEVPVPLPLNITKTENVVDLTTRGEEIVNGLFGIKATSIMATFPPAPAKP